MNFEASSFAAIVTLDSADVQIVWYSFPNGIEYILMDGSLQ